MGGEKVEVSVGLLNLIANYLSKQPYGEVYQLIEALQKEFSNSKTQWQKENVKKDEEKESKSS